jgi:hypothetical protein
MNQIGSFLRYIRSPIDEVYPNEAGSLQQYHVIVDKIYFKSI